MADQLAKPRPDGPREAVERAVREDHERIRMLLSDFREAWLTGPAGSVRRQFHRIEAAVCRHLRWEELDLVDPVRNRLTLLYQHQVIQRDGQAHRDLRDALARVHALLPLRSPSDHDTDHRILECVEELERLLDAHQSFQEAHVCGAVDELHSQAAHTGLAEALRTHPAAQAS